MYFIVDVILKFTEIEYIKYMIYITLIEVSE